MYYEPNEFAQQHVHNKRNTSFFHLNCRGLSANWDSFKFLIETLHSKSFSFDFLGISESFKCEHDSRIFINGYKAIFSATRSNDHRGCVALFLKDTLQYKIRDDLSLFIPNVFESLFIEYQYNDKSKHILGIVYRPNTPPKADLDIFIENMSTILELINKERKMCTIMGDMNIDLLKFSTNEKINTYLENLFLNAFLPTITKPTRIAHNSATLIDHVYCNRLDKSFKSGIIITDVADHYGTIHICYDKNVLNTTKTKEYRKMSDANIATFIDTLSKHDFTNVMQCADVNNSYNVFIDSYQSILNQSFPLATKNITSKQKREPWITPEIIANSHRKSKLYRRKQNNPTEDNITSYKHFNSEFNQLKRFAKTSYYTRIIETNKNDIKKTWSIINDVLGRNRMASTPTKMFFNGEPITNEHSIASMFNTFFIDSVSKIAENIPYMNETYDTYLPNPIKNTMFLDYVEPYEIKAVIDKIKPKTSTGFDDISCKMLKLSTAYIIEPLTHIVNISFSNGIMPDGTKTAKVIPIFKSGEPCIASNYRPVSILPAFSKILEKVMYSKVVKFLDKHNVLYSHQYGFRAKHNTTQPIIHLLDHCAKANSTKTVNFTSALFCDLSKAFDVINHNVLLHKLATYGIRGIALDWFKSYLSNRKQFVRYGSHNSTLTDIVHGVPQGSILGPLLFFIYINDIGFSKDCNILSFADDTTIYMTSDSLPDLFKIANVKIDHMHKWFSANKLYLNSKKTKYMIISPPNQSISSDGLSITIGGNSIERIS